MEKKHVLSIRLYGLTTLFIRAVLVIAIVISLFRAQWETAFASAGILFATYIPRIFERQARLYLPTELELAAIVFIYATLFLGEIRQYYVRFPWWDIVLHIGSAIGFGVIGFMILYFMTRAKKVAAQPITLSLFAFCFAVAIGAVWEMFEFSMDQIFGLNMQKSGLDDTMTDLIVNALGAGIASSLGFFYLRGMRIAFLHNLLARFRRENPQLFGIPK